MRVCVMNRSLAVRDNSADTRVYTCAMEGGEGEERFEGWREGGGGLKDRGVGGGRFERWGEEGLRGGG